jgi:hypothetical protein
MATESRIKFRIKGFQVVENECIWMKAGVVNFKRCDAAYNCQSCAFDKAMRRAMGKWPQSAGRITGIDWGSQMRQKFSGAELPCRHYLTGRVEAPKICTLNNECYHCAYDQLLDDIDLYHPAHRPEIVSASGYQLARDYYYHPGHSWVRIEHGGLSRVGLDDFAASVFGVFQTLTLPPWAPRSPRQRSAGDFSATDRQPRCWPSTLLSRSIPRSCTRTPTTGGGCSWWNPNLPESR